MLRKHHIDLVLLNVIPVVIFAFHNLPYFICVRRFPLTVSEIQLSIIQILRCCKMRRLLMSTFYMRCLVTFWILEWLTGWECVV